MIMIRELTMTCSACPSQWCGTTTDGDSVYIRYRWGGLSVDINDETVLSKDVGDGLDGVMSTRDLARHVKPTICIPRNLW